MPAAPMPRSATKLNLAQGREARGRGSEGDNRKCGKAEAQNDWGSALPRIQIMRLTSAFSSTVTTRASSCFFCTGFTT